MPPKDKFQYILDVLCEVSNFLVAVLMKTATAPETCVALMNSFIGYFGIPVRIVCDQKSSLYVSSNSMVSTYLWHSCNYSKPY